MRQEGAACCPGHAYLFSSSFSLNHSAAECCSFSHRSPSISQILDNSRVFPQVLSRVGGQRLKPSSREDQGLGSGHKCGKSRFVGVPCCPSLTHPLGSLAWDSSVQASASSGVSALQPHHSLRIPLKSGYKPTKLYLGTWTKFLSV